MPEKLLQCYRKVKDKLTKDKPKWSASRIDSVARAICVKQTGLAFRDNDNSLLSGNESIIPNSVSFSESGNLETFNFLFSVPSSVVKDKQLTDVVEEVRKGKDKYQGFTMGEMPNDPNAIIVTGTAIYETVSNNYNFYGTDELIKAVKSMVGIPCQKDHSMSMHDTFGKVISAWHEKDTDKSGQIDYVAVLDGNDPDSGKVQRGYIKNVSIAGKAGTVLCSICNKEMTWNHIHRVGDKYDGKTCLAVIKDLEFIHLGFTPFPAVSGANTDYVPSSMTESIDNTVTCMEMLRYFNQTSEDCVGCNDDNQAIRLNGGNNMADVVQEDNKLLIELQKAQYKLQEMEQERQKFQEQLKKQEQLEKELKIAKEREHSRLVSSVIEAEISLGRLDKDKRTLRENELKLESAPILEAKLQVLKSFLEEADAKSKASIEESNNVQNVPKSRSFATSKFAEMPEDLRKHFQLEAKKEMLAMQMFGQRPSVRAVNTLEKWDYTMNRWKTNFSDLVRKVPRR